jgi:hypothetical protein
MAIKSGLYSKPTWSFAGAKDAVPVDEHSLSPMHSAFYGNEGAPINKWRNYLSIYDKHVSKFRGTNVRLLELGVWKGGSISMWRKYLGPSATIFGIDIQPECAGLAKDEAEVRIGSQDDPHFLNSVVQEMGGIDVVIDDGSHIARHQNASLRILLPLLNPNGGVYICEDTCTAYWRGQYEGGFRRKNNFIETAKRLIDDIHSDFHKNGEEYIGAARSISGVHFYTGMVVIEKYPQPVPLNLSVPDYRL